MYKKRGRAIEEDFILAEKPLLSIEEEVVATPVVLLEAATKVANNAPSKRINMELFEIYKSIYGDLLVPKRFIIPADHRWPEEHHGRRFGADVQRIRQSSNKGENLYDQSDINLLIDNGFVLDAIADNEERTLQAFQEYKNRFGHCNIPSRFRILKDDITWPENVRGVNLGSIVDTMKRKQIYMNIREQVAELGVDLSNKYMVLHYPDLKEVLTIYKSIHGNLDPKTKYIIPAEDVNYPAKFWGYNLGGAVRKIKTSNSYAEHHDELAELGIDYQSYQTKKEQKATTSEVGGENAENAENKPAKKARGGRKPFVPSPLIDAFPTADGDGTTAGASCSSSTAVTAGLPHHQLIEENLDSVFAVVASVGAGAGVAEARLEDSSDSSSSSDDE